MAESLHIMHPHWQSRMIPIPVTFYLTEEMVEDETLTPETLADHLHRDLTYAIEHHRIARRALDG